MSSRSAEKLRPVHIVVAAIAILLGLAVAFNYSTDANAAGGNALCAAEKQKCLEDERAKKNPNPDATCKPKVEAISCTEQECTGKCDYGKGLCKGIASTCPQGKSNTNPKEEKEQKKDDGKPPGETPKIPDPPKKEPKPPEEKKNEDCLAQGKTQEECNKEKGFFDKASSAFNDIWKNLTGQSGTPEVKLEDSAQKLLDNLGSPTPAPQDNPKGSTVGTDTGNKGANANLPEGKTGNTGNGYNPFGANVKGSSQGGGFPKGSAVTGFGPNGQANAGSQASLTAQIQNLVNRIRYLFSKLLGF